MKYELGGNCVIETDVINTKYKTVIGMVFTDTSNLYVYLTYKNDSLQNEGKISLMIKQPSTEELTRFHNQWVFDDVSQLR
jgi:hypothetical protein